MNHRLITTAFALCLLASSNAQAGSMRCGSSLIQDTGRTGPGKYEVLKRCGPPTQELGDVWIYARQSGKKVIRFHSSGKISSITDG